VPLIATMPATALGDTGLVAFAEGVRLVLYFAFNYGIQNNLKKIDSNQMPRYESFCVGKN
jgi:hypothetical protein